MWLHTPKKQTFFRLREGIMLRQPKMMRPDKVGKTVCTVISFLPRVLRHVSHSLGCRRCLSHVPESQRKYHTPSYPSGVWSQKVRNYWASLKRDSKRTSKDP